MDNLMIVSLNMADQVKELCVRMLALSVSVPDGAEPKVCEFFPENSALLQPVVDDVCSALAGVLSGWLTGYSMRQDCAEYRFSVAGDAALAEPLMRGYVQARMAEQLLRVAAPAASQMYAEMAGGKAIALVNLMCRLEQA